MSLFIASLNSGSNGNCYYVGNDVEAVFIDAGLSCSDTEERMERLGLSMNLVKAIFVSHEHSDHIMGLPALTAKYGIPVYVTPATQKELRSRKLQPFARHFETNVAVSIGALSVVGFRKFHDACDPHSFIVSGNNTCIGIFTDIGRACDQVVHHFRQCQAVFLESNYDEDMLRQGRYPWFLKNRIQGGNGHLSNREAMELYRDHKPEGMTHVLLSHLSKENNRPELAKALFESVAKGAEVVIASRHEETLLYQIQPAPPKTQMDKCLPASDAALSAEAGLFPGFSPGAMFLGGPRRSSRKKALENALSPAPKQLRLFY